MAIFNSLGSNYDFGFVFKALFVGNSEENRRRLTEFLEKKYEGRVLLTYKGREALRLALRIADIPKKYAVGICGFTCYAVYEAVEKEGLKARFLDITEGDLNFSLEKFIEIIRKHPSIKVLIIQNTLGFSCEGEKIAKYCRDRGIILIEDLAHSVGAEYLGGHEAGTVGDITVLSFSQDKMVDGISGGALVVRNQELGVRNYEFRSLSTKQQIRDRFYPLFTFLIRETYESGVGKFLHAFLKRFDLLSKPMGKLREDMIFALPNWYCYLIYKQFLGLKEDLIHRRKIASIYTNGLSKNILSSVLSLKIFNGSDLRFSIFVEKREDLIVYLKKHGIYVSDIWYDSPVAPKKYLQLTDYNHDCPNSEKISLRIINLPTHRNVSENDARFIIGKVNEWVANSK